MRTVYVIFSKINFLSYLGLKNTTVSKNYFYSNKNKESSVIRILMKYIIYLSLLPLDTFFHSECSLTVILKDKDASDCSCNYYYERNCLESIGEGRSCSA